MSSLSFLSSLLLLLLHLSTIHSNPFSFKFQPFILEHEELVWLANPGNDDDGDDGGEDSEATPSYQPKKRCF